MVCAIKACDVAMNGPEQAAKANATFKGTTTDNLSFVWLVYSARIATEPCGKSSTATIFCVVTISNLQLFVGSLSSVLYWKIKDRSGKLGKQDESGCKRRTAVCSPGADVLCDSEGQPGKQ